MDLDGDGRLDLVSGSYWPGDIYVFRGLEDGSFAPQERLRDARGEYLTAAEARNEEDADMQGLAAAPWFVDWDGDGVLDLLVGNIEGQVILIPNEGTREKPAFSATRRIAVQAGGETIQVGGGDAGPTVADWDGDGRWDLLVGAGDGSVSWYRNVGEARAPRFEAGRPLLPASETQSVDLGVDPKSPGLRTKVHAVDWDGDGRLDLLVGDFFQVQYPEPELDDAQRARRAELEALLEEVMAELSRAHGASGGEEPDGAELQPLITRWREIYAELEPLTARQVPTGRVWLYQRIPEAQQEG